MTKTVEELELELEASRKEIERLNTPKPPEPSELEKRLRAALEPPKEESAEAKEIREIKATLDALKKDNIEGLLGGLSEEDRAKLAPIVEDMTVSKAKQTIQTFLDMKQPLPPVGGMPAAGVGGVAALKRYEEGFIFKKDPKHYTNGMVT